MKAEFFAHNRRRFLNDATTGIGAIALALPPQWRGAFSETTAH